HPHADRAEIGLPAARDAAVFDADPTAHGAALGAVAGDRLAREGLANHDSVGADIDKLAHPRAAIGALPAIVQSRASQMRERALLEVDAARAIDRDRGRRRNAGRPLLLFPTILMKARLRPRIAPLRQGPGGVSEGQ